MKLINASNVPESVLHWLRADFYDTEAAAGTLSATTLLKPTQEIVLTERHWDQIEVDALDRVWSLFGSAVHYALDNPNEKEEGVIAPERLYAEVAGVKVSGKYDRVKNKEVADYKVTSAWTIVYGSRIGEWKKQLSEYRWLYWKNYQVELSPTGRIVAILRDWAERDAAKGGKYPASPIIEIEVKLMGLFDTEMMISEKVRDILAARQLPTGQLPKCTDEERWWNESKRQYMKCAKYCQVAKFCTQFNPALAQPELGQLA